MFKKYIPTSHEDWLRQRTSTIGGSEVATILGINPYETPYMLWRRKTDERNGIYSEEQNTAMRVGHYLEDAVAQMWHDTTSLPIIKNTSGDWIALNDDYPFAHVSPDRLYWADGHRAKGLLECKTTMKDIDLSDIDNATVLMYFAQVQWGLGILGLEHGSLACFKLGRREFVYQDYDFDPEFFSEMYDKVSDFMTNYVIAGAEPPSTSIEDLSLRYPNSSPDKVITASDELENTHRLLTIVSEEIAQLESEKAKYEEEIKLALGDGEILDYGGRMLATWKTSKPSQTFNKAKFQSDHPDLYSKYLEPKSGTRRFVLKK